MVHDPRLLFPDTLSMATDGYLYVTADQLHRQATYQHGKDLHEWPYHVFRTRSTPDPYCCGENVTATTPAPTRAYRAQR